MCVVQGQVQVLSSAWGIQSSHRHLLQGLSASPPAGLSRLPRWRSFVRAREGYFWALDPVPLVCVCVFVPLPLLTGRWLFVEDVLSAFISVP